MSQSSGSIKKNNFIQKSASEYMELRQKNLKMLHLKAFLVWKQSCMHWGFGVWGGGVFFFKTERSEDSNLALE